MSRPPFTSQLDHAVRAGFVAGRRGKPSHGRAMTPQAMEAACARYEAALEKSPDDWDLHRALGKWRWRAVDPGLPPST